MTRGTLQIHSENILPIIKKWLYSDKDIFVRELVSNACDAIYKVKVLRDQGECQVSDDDFRIEVKIDKEKRTLTFSDTGIGMDAEEVVKYIAQIAFSSAEEFMGKYKSNNEKDQIIGHFGLGFYSAYMVASKVDVDTLSYKEGAKPVLWSCDGSQEYDITEGTRTTRGTTITLHIDQDNDEYLEEGHLRKILTHYCSFLPYPIFLGDSLINKEPPLWIKQPSECTEEDYLQFYRHLYPMESDPLFWVHLNVDYPFHLKGILYFPKIHRNFELDKQSIQLYSNRVFVSDNCKDVIPQYLMALRGVIDSPDIPLNVSRSYLQMDRTVRQLGAHISKKVADSLTTLYRTSKDKYIEAWKHISLVIKLGAIEDEKFYDKVKGILIWRTTDGEWLTIEEYLERYRDKTQDTIFYTSDEKQLAQFSDLFQQRGIGILCADHPIDTYLIQQLERKHAPATFKRFDAAVHEHFLDKEREKIILDAEGKTEAGRLADLIRTKLSNEHIEVEAKSLASDAISAFVTIDENQRRLRDYMLTMERPDDTMAMDLIGKKTLVVNTNNPLIASLPSLDSKNPDLTKDIVIQIYELALLSQREMDPKGLNAFITRTNRVLEKLAQHAVGGGQVKNQQQVIEHPQSDVVVQPPENG